MPKITVVPCDQLIIVDGVGLCFDYPHPPSLRALQWEGEPGTGSGHLEFSDDYNMALGPILYEDEVQPYLELWQAEKRRLEAEAAVAEEARLAAWNSEGARYSRLRAARDARMAATDYLLMPDYPLAEPQRAEVIRYRQALRDLPAQEGAPWDGGGEATPWPDAPAVAMAQEADDAPAAS